MKNMKNFDLVARVQMGEGCAFDMDVSQHMDVFIDNGEEAVKDLIRDDDTYVFFVRLEEAGNWSML